MRNIYGDLTNWGTGLFKKAVEVGGDFSRLKLNSNLADNSDDEFGIRFINGVAYGRFGTVSLPLQALGINPDLASIYGTTMNPINAAFGEVVSPPIYYNDPAPDLYPYLPVTTLSNGQIIVGHGYKHQGADIDSDTVGYYLKDKGIVENITGDPWKVNSNSYMYDFIANLDDDNSEKVAHTGVANIIKFEKYGRIDVNGSNFSNGHMLSGLGLSGTYSGGDASYFSIGINTFSSNSFLTMGLGGGAAINTTIPWNTPASFKLVVVRIDTLLISYELYINGVLELDDGNYVVTRDIKDFTDVYHKIFNTTISSFAGASVIKDYGNLTVYTVEP